MAGLPVSVDPSQTPSVVASYSPTSQSNSSKPPGETQIANSPLSQTPTFASSPVSSFYGTRTILGPLTTPFSAPADCDIPYFANGGSNIFYGINCPTNSIANGATSCFPYNFVNSAGVLGNYSSSKLQVYSPATQCPQGWTSACGASRIDYTRALGDTYLTNWMNPGEAMQICCPLLFECDFPFLSELTPKPGDNPLMQCTAVGDYNGAGAGPGKEYECGTGTQRITRESVTHYLVTPANAPPIALLTGPSSVPSLTTSNGSSVPNPQSPPSPAISQPAPSPTNVGMSDSTKIGIGLGVSFAVLLILILALLTWLSCFRKRNPKDDFDGKEYKSELEANNLRKRQIVIAELEGPSIVELDGTSQLVEVDGNWTPAKLDDVRD